MNLKRLLIMIFISFCFLGLFLNHSFAATTPTVYIIPIKDEITPAMSAFVTSEIKNAHQINAQGIIFEIATLGGRVDATLEMKQAIMNSKIPTVVFVQERAISAGALITIAAETIIMAPGSQMGAAEPRPFSEKAVAFVRGEFGSTAQARNRDPQIAEAMVDKEIEIEGLVEKGAILSLKAVDAQKHDYAEAILPDRNAVLDFMGWSNADVIESIPNFKFRIAQFLTGNALASILLTLGFIALVIELFTQGFGLAGIIAICSFGLYFGGNIIAGNTEWWSFFLFLLGLGLLTGEMFVPGFGILGIGGITAIVASIIFAAPEPQQGMLSLGIAFISCVIIVPVLLMYFEKAGLFNRLVLNEAETTESGYVSSFENNDLIGKTGRTVTPLRPSGIALVDDKRIDVVTNGEYLPIDTEIKIIKVEGARIVVAKA